MKLNQITLQSLVQCNDEIDVTNLDDEIVMMDLNLGRYYMLNQTASQIWNLVKSPISIQDLIEKLIALYEVQIEECRDQVLSLCDALHKLNLIIVL